MKFSERIGITPSKAIQLKSMDDDLRNGLWNVVFEYFLEDIADQVWATDSMNFEFFKTIWSDHFKKHTDNIPPLSKLCIPEIKYSYFKW